MYEYALTARLVGKCLPALVLQLHCNGQASAQHTPCCSNATASWESALKTSVLSCSQAQLQTCAAHTGDAPWAPGSGDKRDFTSLTHRSSPTQSYSLKTGRRSCFILYIETNRELGEMRRQRNMSQMKKTRQKTQKRT